ncbi:Glutamate-1-semialdehyde 2,1-aminomutase [hydrothermal vent metagenome]|uniref:glutamate-1-semialdehyde 2,1-aminomutase n=1 Tax=hydrothermal vent metagenome TaxID=652676 RepID=A0A3B1DY94_9ZZZZ
MNTTYSKKYFQEAEKFLVGGVNSPVRCFNGVGGHPLIMKYGQREKLYDYDNNAYTDYCLSWGALILGHAHRNAVLAAKKTAEKGFSFGTTTRDEIEIAKHIVNCVPSIEKIRFVNSGTEATMSTIRLARGFTKKDMIVKFDGCYHGHFDDLLTKAGSGVAQLQESSSIGIPKKHIENTLSLPYNAIDTCEKTLKQHKDKIACVIIEPVAGNMGVIPAQKKFLQALRDLTKKHNIVLIFDEVMSGFRTNAGCVQSDYGITPDITCLGKIIGGGFPIGAYGGRKDIMEHLAPLGSVYQAGTFSGTPVIMKTGLASLRLLDENFYRKLNEKSETFSNAINTFFKENNINAHMSHYKSMLSLRFRKEPVYNYADAQAATGGERYAQLFNHLLKNNIYWPPADLESFFISGMHTKKSLSELLEALKIFFIKPSTTPGVVLG